MSEEKIYAVKNDEGLLSLYSIDGIPLCRDKSAAERVAREENGHVVTLIEEPEKLVLTKEQAEIVENAHYAKWPATYISTHTGSNSRLENQLMNAYVNGYTVAKEKKYSVELDGLVTTDGAKQYLTKEDGKWFASRRMPGLHQDFTDEELNKAPEWAQQLDCEEVTADIEHCGLQDCEKFEVIDDE